MIRAQDARDTAPELTRFTNNLEGEFTC
jgi:hypothetical protein